MSQQRIALVEISRDRRDNPAFQRLAGRLAEGAREVVARDYDAQMLYADELSAEQLIERTRDADAVIFLGGEDVDPACYGGEPEYPGGGTHQTLADERQIELIRHLEQQRTPVLGICRGAQIVNVALGGTLVQHLEVPDHRNPDILNDLTLATHPVEVEAQSRVGRAMAEAAGAEVGGGTVTVDVQSAHHQAIDRAGEGLRVVARGPHGVVEAIEHERAPILGVQWHPEDPNTSGEQVTFLLRVLTGENDTTSLV